MFLFNTPANQISLVIYKIARAESFCLNSEKNLVGGIRKVLGVKNTQVFRTLNPRSRMLRPWTESEVSTVFIG